MSNGNIWMIFKKRLMIMKGLTFGGRKAVAKQTRMTK